MSRRRILVLIKGLGIGGAERLIAESARFWDRTRFDYRVAYVLPWKDELVPAIEATGTTVHLLGSGPLRTSIRPLRRLVADWHPDIIHAHLPTTGILARLGTTTPVVYTEHNLASSYRTPTRQLNRLTYGRNHAVIAVSDAVARSVQGFPGPAPLVIHNAVAPTVGADARPRIRAELGIAPDQPLVVHVGNIRPHKGHRYLTEIAHTLKLVIPGVVIVSVGGEKHGGELSDLRQERDACGLRGTLRFLGRREDAWDIISAADVLINPSDVEGLPVTILEAMALGTPVVATDVGGVGDVVLDGVTGRLVAPGDPHALAGATIELLTAPQTARDVAEAASRLVADRFGLETMVRRIEHVYEQVLE